MQIYTFFLKTPLSQKDFLNGKSPIVVIGKRIISLATINTMFATRKHGVYAS